MEGSVKMLGKEIICIIPAKGNSKRLPGKNVMPFLGKPLIAHSILAAKASVYVKDTFVSTDDDAIKEIAIAYGAKVIRRPEHLCTDYATTASALKHALLSNEISPYIPFAVVTLQPTNPLRPVGLIDRAINKFMNSDNKAHSLIAVSLSRHKIGKIDNGYFTPVTYSAGQRSQDLIPYYYENGLLYITRSDIIIDRESVLGDYVLTEVVEGPFGDIDIDEQIDFEWAKFIEKKYRK